MTAINKTTSFTEAELVILGNFDRKHRKTVRGSKKFVKERRTVFYNIRIEHEKDGTGSLIGIEILRDQENSPLTINHDPYE